MRLTVKLVAWFFVCVVLGVGINAYVGVRAELAQREADLAARHVVMGLVLREAFEEVAETDGEARAVSMLDYTDKRLRLVDVRWVHLEPDAPVERRPYVGAARLAPIRADHEVHDKADGRLRSYIPVHVEGRSVTALEFSESLEGEQALVRQAFMRALRAVLAVALAVGVAAALLGFLLVAQPMRALVAHARRIGHGDLSPAAASARNDEIAELGREMNAMCTKLSEAQASSLKALDQLRHAERLSTVGTLASGLAHELGTPLNVITLRAKAIAQGRAAGEGARDAATSIGEQATRMTNLVRQLLDFARRKTTRRVGVDLPTLTRRSAELVEPVAAKARITLTVLADDHVPAVSGDAAQLEQVFTNLLVNAIHSMSSSGTIHVTTRATRTMPPADVGDRVGDYVRVEVRDEGAGIDSEALPHIFEPFFTTKEVGEGTGLGLAVCYGIVRDHGGWIDVVTSPGAGSAFSVYFPKES